MDVEGLGALTRRWSLRRGFASVPLLAFRRRCGVPSSSDSLAMLTAMPRAHVLREPFHPFAPDRLILVQHVGEDLAALGIEDLATGPRSSSWTRHGRGKRRHGLLIARLLLKDEANSGHRVSL
jgi:hypothetical protein